jgi:hypothetical protein
MLKTRLSAGSGSARSTASNHHAACGMCLLLFSGAFALSLDLYEGNTYYGRSDKFDTTSVRDNFYEDLNLALRNPGDVPLSFSSDVSVTNDKTTGMPTQYDIRSTSLDWAPESSGISMSLGRQFVNSFARDAGYLDGLTMNYDAGRVLSLAAFAGTAAPSRYTDSIVSIDPRRVEAGLYGIARIVRGTELGIGLASDKEDADQRHYHAAGSVRSDVDHIVDFKGHARYDITARSMDDYFLQASLVKWNFLRFGLHVAGQSEQIDSVNYYERLFLNKYNEGGMLLGLYAARDISLEGNYSLRSFGEGIDHLASCNILAKGASLRLCANTGVHGTTYEIVPGYTFTYARIGDVGAAFQFDRYKTLLQPDWSNAYTAYAYGRWTVPWFTPVVSLVLEPQVEYLVNDYYKKDVRVLFMSRFNFHEFWQSGRSDAQDKVK